MCNTDNKLFNNKNGSLLDKSIELIDSAMLKHFQELWCEWDFEKNNELGIDIYKVTKGSTNKTWWYCEKCKDSYLAIVANKTKGNKCSICTGRYVSSVNSLESLNPTLAKEWHPTKNIKAPKDFTVSSGKKVWWICKKEHEWEAAIRNRNNGTGCPYCSNQKVCRDNSLKTRYPNIASQWHQDKNAKNPCEVVYGSGEVVWWECDKGHEYKCRIVSRVNDNISCPYCANTKLLVGYNDMWTTNPELASLLANSEDGYKYMQSSKYRVDWKCPDCEEIIKDKSINQINRNTVSCPQCRDGVSFPEKIMFNLLTSLKLDFISQKKFEWSQGKIYDFYIPSLNTIIETHGGQHYKQTTRKGARTLEEEQVNDKLKYNMAIDNAVTHYIAIDCRSSDLLWIKRSVVNSELNNIFNLSDVKWDELYTLSQKSIKFKIVELWNNDYSIPKIKSELKLHKSTILETLKRFTYIGKCNYSSVEATKRARKINKIHQFDINGNLINIWNGMGEIYNELNYYSSGISDACNGNKRTYKGFIWKFEKDLNKEEI